MARDLRPCGTYAAYQRHRAHGERPCDACVAAERAYMQAYRSGSIGPRPVIECGTQAGYDLHRRRGEKPCGPCVKAHSLATNAPMRTRRVVAAMTGGLAPASDTGACGTARGYQRHYQRAQEPCDACREAYNARQRERYGAAKAAKRGVAS